MNKRQGAKNFLWNAVGTGINCVMSFIYIVIITRLNDIDTAGLFSVCFSVSIILFTFSNLGNRVYEVSDRKTSDSLYFTLKIFSGALSLVAGLIFCFTFKYDATKTLIVVSLTFVRIIESLSDTLYAVFQKNERLDLVGISYVVKNLVTVGVFVAVDMITKNILACCISMIITTFLVYFVFDKLICKKFEKVSFCKLNGLLSLVKDISYFVIFNLIVVVIANIPRLLADTGFSNKEMGYFSIIMMIPTVMALLGQFVIQPSLNGFIDKYEDKDFDGFKKTSVYLMAVLVICAVICSVAAYYLGPPILGLIMGVNLKSFAGVMTLAIVAGMFNILTTFVSTLLTVMHRTSKQLLLYVLTLLIEIIVVFIAVHSKSLTNVFIAYTAVMIVQYLIFLFYYVTVFNKEKQST